VCRQTQLLQAADVQDGMYDEYMPQGVHAADSKPKCSCQLVALKTKQLKDA
jgi:hypothetical protein